MSVFSPSARGALLLFAFELRLNFQAGCVERGQLVRDAILEPGELPHALCLLLQVCSEALELGDFLHIFISPGLPVF